jgi:hypothetical protein
LLAHLSQRRQQCELGRSENSVIRSTDCACMCLHAFLYDACIGPSRASSVSFAPPRPLLHPGLYHRQLYSLIIFPLTLHLHFKHVTTNFIPRGTMLRFCARSRQRDKLNDRARRWRDNKNRAAVYYKMETHNRRTGVYKDVERRRQCYCDYLYV